jgi:hypothetical protein
LICFLLGSVFANTGLNAPYGLTFDSAGSLYVANNGNGTIVRFTPAGVGSLFATSASGELRGLAFDSAGNLYAAHAYNNTIEKFTPGGVGSLFANSGLSGPTPIVIEVPEPPTLAMLGLGIAAILSLKCRRALANTTGRGQPGPNRMERTGANRLAHLQCVGHRRLAYS